MLNKLKHYDLIITLGFYNPSLLAKCDICFYPFLDCETDFYVRYEVGTEEGVVALFLCEFADGGADSALNNFTNALDYGYLSAETNVSEEELLRIKSAINDAQNPLLIIGDDIFSHPRKDNILNMLSALRAHSKLDIKCENLSQNYHLEMVAELPEYNGCVIYLNNSAKNELKISSEFARAWRLSDRDNISFQVDDKMINTSCKLDKNFSGVIGILEQSTQSVGYKFKTIAIKRH